MRRKYFTHPIIFLSLLSILFVTSCSSDPEVKTETDIRKKTVLLYAVASNNLYDNLIDDKAEMLEAASGMNLDGLSMLVYQVTPSGNPELLELSKDAKGNPDFVTIKTYDRNEYSTDPKRISRVISDVVTLREADSYGLILWSHGTGIDPAASTRSGESEPYLPYDSPVCFSFGMDKDSDKNPNYSDKIDVDELADAIPSDLFEFIWFDACYMGGIETVYELRDKCQVFVGYPTEVFVPGMPYNLTLPHILREKSDLKGGAEKFFKYYAESKYSSMQVATIAVLDMNGIEKVADACKEIYKASPSAPSASGLQCYSRRSVGPFYDFGQYTGRMASLANVDLNETGFNQAMKEFVIWKAATPVDFNYNEIVQDNFSGISCHLYNPASSTDKSKFYTRLDWFKRVY